MSWNYAELSQKAKAVGGPEKLVEILIDSGKQVGRSEMKPWIVVAALGASAATLGISKIVDVVKKKKIISIEETEKAKKELVQGIRKYDEEQAVIHDYSADDSDRRDQTGNE